MEFAEQNGSAHQLEPGAGAGRWRLPASVQEDAPPHPRGLQVPLQPRSRRTSPPRPAPAASRFSSSLGPGGQPRPPRGLQVPLQPRSRRTSRPAPPAASRSPPASVQEDAPPRGLQVLLQPRSRRTPRPAPRPPGAPPASVQEDAPPRPRGLQVPLQPRSRRTSPPRGLQVPLQPRSRRTPRPAPAASRCSSEGNLPPPLCHHRHTSLPGTGSRSPAATLLWAPRWVRPGGLWGSSSERSQQQGSQGGEPRGPSKLQVWRLGSWG
ncbi:proline-rich protein HaeIII subfamily 1-like [Canis lupus familiaris]|uniref:proline-rich protein HaeIII subfamily 1-like n=1 Tax=Canis lupus familiaris TaxID=9615 RepID=UPI0018F46669|nr:proline-rich protein HaeIII subfamily 1-like [Canis lupus familiaris]